ncbi:hypothetical protein MRX96_022275 [Rhipicephalus microplus]
MTVFRVPFGNTCTIADKLLDNLAKANPTSKQVLQSAGKQEGPGNMVLTMLCWFNLFDGGDIITGICGWYRRFRTRFRRDDLVVFLCVTTVFFSFASSQFCAITVTRYIQVTVLRHVLIEALGSLPGNVVMKCGSAPMEWVDLSILVLTAVAAGCFFPATSASKALLSPLTVTACSALQLLRSLAPLAPMATVATAAHLAHQQATHAVSPRATHTFALTCLGDPWTQDASSKQPRFLLVVDVNG